MITRIIYPLALREKINVQLYKFFPNISDKDISLEFNAKLKMDLFKKDYGHKSLIFNGFYELKLTRAIVALAKKGGLMIDVGANYGYFSCLWAGQKPSNKVIAFEASPENFTPLINNIAKNKLDGQVHVLSKAAGKSNGTLQFNTGGHEEQTSWGGFTIVDDRNSFTVDVITLDEYVAENNIKDIELLKVDTEGADTWVLYGAESLLREKRIHHIFFEHNLHRMSLLNINHEESHTFLEKLDYVIEKFSTNEFHAYPRS